MPVAVFLSVTVAPGRTPPDESRTAPSTVDVSNCAKAAGTLRRHIATMTNRRRDIRVMRVPPEKKSRSLGSLSDRRWRNQRQPRIGRGPVAPPVRVPWIVGRGHRSAVAGQDVQVIRVVAVGGPERMIAVAARHDVAVRHAKRIITAAVVDTLKSVAVRMCEAE